MKSLIGAGIAAVAMVATSCAAQAADIPRSAYPRPVYKSAALTPVYYNWTGFYLGANGGYGTGHSEWTDPLGVGLPGSTTGSFTTKGGVFGATFGYNHQIGSFVIGVEGDYDWSDIKGSSSAIVCAGSSIGCQTKNSWLATARGRFGYAMDRFLPYFTGGVAYGNIRAATDLGTDTSTKLGYAFGAGVEYAFLDNWSAKLEYLYVGLDDGTCNLACGGTPIDVKFNTSLIRAGLNYKFFGPIFSRD